jgi:uncharacterized membrane protein YeiH
MRPKLEVISLLIKASMCCIAGGWVVQMLIASDATYWTLHNHFSFISFHFLSFPFLSFPFPSFAPTTFYLIP